MEPLTTGAAAFALWAALHNAEDPMPDSDPLTDERVLAFLDTIASAEGTLDQPDPYRVYFGYGRPLESLAGHPVDLGIRDYVPVGSDWTSAAGKYQITRRTWSGNTRGKPAGSPAQEGSLVLALRLPDFSAESQDRAAVELLRRRGVLARILAGDAVAVINSGALGAEWASFPGGNGARPAGWVAAAYTSHLSTGYA